MQSEASGVTDMLKRFRRFLLGSEPPDDRLERAHDAMTREAGKLRDEIASCRSAQKPDECGAPDDVSCPWRIRRRAQTSH